MGLAVRFDLCELCLYSVQKMVYSLDQLTQLFGVPFSGDSLRQFTEKMRYGIVG
jgi:hypothetical protein